MRATYKQSCADCDHYFWYGEMVFLNKDGRHICQECSEKESGLVSKWITCTLFGSQFCFQCTQCSEKENEPMSKCRNCGRTFLHGDVILYGALGCYCANRKNCFNKRKSMPNIKITAEVDGKIVPLNTISTETFEAIKALEKPKEIPVARIGHYKNNPSDKRLFLKITDSIRCNAKNESIDVIAINLQDGCVNNIWKKSDEANNIHLYENIQPL